MGLLATMAMTDQGLEDGNSKKLHPFFLKTVSYSSTEQIPIPTVTANETNETRRETISNPTAPHNLDHAATSSLECVYPSPESVVSAQQPEQPPQRQTVVQQQSIINYANAHRQGSALAPHPSEQKVLVATTDVEPPAISLPAATLPAAASQPTQPASSVDAPPRKVLKFNLRTGTLGSPPKPKLSRKGSRIVTIKYGHNVQDRKRIGDKICQILSGELDVGTKAPETKVKNNTKDKSRQETSRTTHPFFAKEKASEPLPRDEKKKRHTVFMSTPVSPKKPRNCFTSGQGPSFSVKPISVKVPGAKHPLWPPRGFSHIRGAELMAPPSSAALFKTVPVRRLTKKKSKGQTVSIKSHESILELFVRRLDITHVKRSLPKNDDVFPPPPAELRLPTRHFESGCKLAKRIRPEIQSNVAPITTSGIYLDEDDLAQQPSQPVHPIVDRHWRSLARQLSAFDRSTCESVSWVSKYAPVRATEVLQTGREVALLKQWLETLRVQGVDSAGDSCTKSKGEVKKKKRKSKLDDFVVDSEDESGEMNELSDLEEQSPHGIRRSRPSVARSLDLAGKDPSKLSNTVLISGPHGCGKSASVYAVARELGFEVFEINSGTRRSGKDVLERVGDMTRNHLVQHHRAEAMESGEDSGASSSKQGTMTSFFKPKMATEKKKKHRSVTRAREDVGRSPSSKSQKQSLILVEEVDILFEEDKQFWASLQSLMAQSKRPFILTCNDESAVPMNTLDLHGIFRFLPPPEYLAVDTCLLIAANEGHALRRRAVRALYQRRGYDLRGTITDLQFWCQIGVGDRRGGHDWFYPRWPKGCDLDEQGQVVRVISGDTYQTGMGWLGRDGIVAAPSKEAMENEAAEQAWQFWRRDLSDAHGSVDLDAISTPSSTDRMSRQQRIDILSAYANYHDTLSFADSCSAGVLGLELDEILDPTLPEMPARTKDDFTIAQSLLEADPLQIHSCSRYKIFSSLSGLALDSLKRSATSILSPGVIQKPETSTEEQTTATLEDTSERDNHRLTRYDVAVAFDPIAVSPKAAASLSLDPSVFDRTMTMIVVEVAPWVRGIVHYEEQLMQDRQRLNELLDDGGSTRKRRRTTRSAYSALEGGERRTTRRERYFGDVLSTEAVMYTAGKHWQQALPLGEKWAEAEDDLSSSPMSARTVEDVARTA